MLDFLILEKSSWMHVLGFTKQLLRKSQWCECDFFVFFASQSSNKIWLKPTTFKVKKPSRIRLETKAKLKKVQEAAPWCKHLVPKDSLRAPSSLWSHWRHQENIGFLFEDVLGNSPLGQEWLTRRLFVYKFGICVHDEWERTQTHIIR